MALHGKNRDGGGGGAGDTNDLASNWVSSAGASQSPPSLQSNPELWKVQILLYTSGYATWFTAGGAIRIAHYYDVNDDVITRKL